MNSLMITYCCGVLGSLCVELTYMLEYSRSHRGHLPAIYRRPAFVVARIFFALFAGIFPLASGVTNYMTAIEIGATAQVIVAKILREYRPYDERK